MFSKTLVAALVSLPFAFNAQGAPAAASSCGAVSVRTVTVTATATAGTPFSSSSGSGHSFISNGNGGQKGSRNKNLGKGSGGQGSGNGSKGSGGSKTSTATSIAASSTASSGSGSGNAGDPQSSLQLDPAVIAKGFAQDGQETPAAGQVASLTSKNNFANFCLTTKQPITNGQQIKTGSCNPAPMGQIPATTAMPSSKFTFPKNFGTVAANKAFTITMAVQNLDTGHFVNAQTNYFAAPQQLNSQGKIVGHSHVVIERLSSLTQTTPGDPTNFAFFLGLNNAAKGGVLSAAVSQGLPAGAYKLSSINTAANHQPVLGPVAQHGSFDDAVYFTVSDKGAASSNSTASNSSAPAAAPSTSGSAVKSAGTSPNAKGSGSAAASSTAKGSSSKNPSPATKPAASPAAKGAASSPSAAKASAAAKPKASKA